MPSPETRVAFVSGARLPGWVERFAASHGALVEEELDAGLRLRAADGAVALLQAPWPVDGRPGRGARRGGPPGLPGLAAADASGLYWSAAAAIRWPWSAPAPCWRPRPARGTSSPGRLRAAGPSSVLPGGAPTRPMPWWRRSRSTPAGFSRSTGSSTWRPGGDRTLADQVLAEPVLKQYAGTAAAGVPRRPGSARRGPEEGGRGPVRGADPGDGSTGVGQRLSNGPAGHLLRTVRQPARRNQPWCRRDCQAE